MKSSVWSEDELSNVKNVDRILPSQKIHSKMYKGKDFYGDLEKTLFSMYPQREFQIETKPGMSYAVMGSEINTLKFYQFLIRSHGYKKVLELGTYIGVSAMYMAEAGAHVTTIECGTEFWRIAQTNLRLNRLLSKVDCKHYDAIKYMKDTTTKFDLILIDCAKQSYHELLELSLSRLNAGGMILIDDVFFQGDTLNSTPKSEKGIGVRKALDFAASLTEWDKVIVPIGNGLLLMRQG